MHEPLALFAQEKTAWPIGSQPPKDPQPNPEGAHDDRQPYSGPPCPKRMFAVRITPYYIEVRREGEK